jgi:hypothetical protein
MSINPIQAEKAALAADIEAYSAARGIQPTTFGRLAGLGGNFHERLGIAEVSPRWETMQKAREYMTRHPVASAETHPSQPTNLLANGE